MNTKSNQMRVVSFVLGAVLLPLAGHAAGPLPICGAGKRVSCVVDGDTFWIDGTKVRIAGIDTPETASAKCAGERAKGERAKLRLQRLLNDGPFDLVATSEDEDKCGRKLRMVTRGGHSLGDVLVAEGLARRWDGARHSWCD